MKKILYSVVLVLAWCTVEAQPAADFDRQMRAAGMCDVQQADSTVRVHLKYSTTDNFIGKDMYGALERAYLERSFAQKVVRAQRLLRKLYPNYSLLIWDAARPLSVQRTMRAAVEGTPLQIYVADARRGGRHNYGVAVDLTIVDAHGRELDMGTTFDFFGDAAHLGHENELVAAGKISVEALNNRQLLERVMRAVGLVPYVNEWWHWQEKRSMPDTRLKYKLLDF